MTKRPCPGGPGIPCGPCSPCDPAGPTEIGTGSAVSFFLHAFPRVVTALGFFFWAQKPGGWGGGTTQSPAAIVRAIRTVRVMGPPQGRRLDLRNSTPYGFHVDTFQ